MDDARQELTVSWYSSAIGDANKQSMVSKPKAGEHMAHCLFQVKSPSRVSQEDRRQSYCALSLSQLPPHAFEYRPPPPTFYPGKMILDAVIHPWWAVVVRVSLHTIYVRYVFMMEDNTCANIVNAPRHHVPFPALAITECSSKHR